MADTFGVSHTFPILAVIDDCCRENLCLGVDTSTSGARVASELDALVQIYGKPNCIVSDNSTEFTSRAILRRAEQNNDCLTLHRSGRAAAERFCRDFQWQPA